VKDLGDYSTADWRRLRPIVHAYKTARYRALNAWYVRQEVSRASSLIRRINKEKPALAITIAFESAWVVQKQIDAARRNLADASLIVCDNSRTRESSDEISEICSKSGIQYFRLPNNPASAASRSHALAINWAYRNIVCPVRPRCFAFLDHDMFPVEPMRLCPLVERQPFYGRLRQVGNRWFLWAGYCIFDGRYAEAPILDFAQDWFIGLDTGGRNYRRLFKSYDLANLNFARVRLEDHRDPATGDVISVELIDGWLHVGNVSGWDSEQRREEAVLARTVSSILERGSAGPP
jgi:hypothetical protein